MMSLDYDCKEYERRSIKMPVKAYALIRLHAIICGIELGDLLYKLVPIALNKIEETAASESISEKEALEKLYSKCI